MIIAAEAFDRHMMEYSKPSSQITPKYPFFLDHFSDTTKISCYQLKIFAIPLAKVVLVLLVLALLIFVNYLQHRVVTFVSVPWYFENASHFSK
jgi:hypothetical protein